MKVGVMLPQAAEDGDGGTWGGIVALARRAEAGGLDSIWLSDHFSHHADDGSETGYHEPWSLLAALAVATERIELGTLVLATSFRPPGLLAKMAATTDDIAAGRLILGIGCGWHEPEYRAFGYPFDHRVGRFEESLRVIDPLLRGERVTFEGRWTTVEGAAILPPPLRRIPLLIAAKGERMLRLTARYADAWQIAWFGLPDARFASLRAGLLEACRLEGRDAATLQQTVGIDVAGPDDDAGSIGPRTLPLDAVALADGLATWAEAGVDHVQLGLVTLTGPTCDVVIEAIRRFRSSGRR
jgi:alkanesulfonate monooxygenase SsuD/methylene tetrahydromethanopterin reductase-like flavin-dependent oxidoreductase (luciferase family)